ncbi:hypothetical protein [Brevundimonas sp.]|uniref:hypothetical protein n=1 Tax=Brevundimonas sp. TaxID=1871086 RepID=UPI002D72D4C6|nr:hypothetical protein [Brevundimonas sp.]HYC97439.1 hypothetical protein [Brevundimonas sp.]
MRRLAGIVAGMALMAGGAPALAQAGPDKPLTTLGIAEVRALATETGGVPGEVEHLDNNEYQIEIAYPDGLFVQFEGWSCTGEGEAKRCAEFMMHVNFELDSEAEALAMEHEVNIVWLSDMAIGNRLKVWRMDYLAGMTRGRMRGMFETFLSTVGTARDIAFPAKGDGATGAK